MSHFQILKCQLTTILVGSLQCKQNNVNKTMTRELTRDKLLSERVPATGKDKTGEVMMSKGRFSVGGWRWRPFLVRAHGHSFVFTHDHSSVRAHDIRALLPEASSCVSHSVRAKSCGCHCVCAAVRTTARCASMCAWRRVVAQRTDMQQHTTATPCSTTCVCIVLFRTRSLRSVYEKSSGYFGHAPCAWWKSYGTSLAFHWCGWMCVYGVNCSLSWKNAEIR